METGNSSAVVREGNQLMSVGDSGKEQIQNSEETVTVHHHLFLLSLCISYPREEISMKPERGVLPRDVNGAMCTSCSRKQELMRMEHHAAPRVSGGDRKGSRDRGRRRDLSSDL